MLKTRLEEKEEHFEQGPVIGQLSKMGFTTKHQWCILMGGTADVVRS